MKKLLLTLCAIAALSASALAGPDHVEIGQFFTLSGQRVTALYEVEKDQCKQVFLIMPNGKKIQVDVGKGTSTNTLDRSLQHIIDQQL